MTKKKPIPPLEKHKTHNVEIQASTAHNYAKYYCLDCEKWIAWLSKSESQKAYELGLVKIDQNNTITSQF